MVDNERLSPSKTNFIASIFPRLQVLDKVAFFKSAASNMLNQIPALPFDKKDVMYS